MNFAWKQILIDNELVFIKFWIKLSKFFVKITGGPKLFVYCQLRCLSVTDLQNLFKKLFIPGEFYC